MWRCSAPLLNLSMSFNWVSRGLGGLSNHLPTTHRHWNSLPSVAIRPNVRIWPLADIGGAGQNPSKPTFMSTRLGQPREHGFHVDRGRAPASCKFYRLGYPYPAALSRMMMVRLLSLPPFTLSTSTSLARRMVAACVSRLESMLAVFGQIRLFLTFSET